MAAEQLRITVDGEHSVSERQVSRGRWRNWHTLKVGEVEGGGYTIAEARHDLAQNLARAVANLRPPVTLTYAGNTSQVYADAFGICVSHGSSYSRGDWTWEQAEASARFQLVTIGCDPHDDGSLRDAIAFLRPARDERDRNGPADLLSWAAFQRAYRHAEQLGEKDPHGWTAGRTADFLPDIDVERVAA